MAITADLVRQNNVFHNKKLADLFKILIVKKKISDLQSSRIFIFWNIMSLGRKRREHMPLYSGNIFLGAGGSGRKKRKFL